MSAERAAEGALRALWITSRAVQAMLRAQHALRRC
jgi:hypothetical protein